MRFLKKWYYKISGKPFTQQEISDRVIKAIRDGGGQVGENVDIIESKIDLGAPYLIKIGNNVTITCVRILTHDASLKKKIGYTKVGKVHIGDNVFIGAGSIILPNVSIGNNCIVGAGTVVAKDVPNNSVVIGNPMRVISTYDACVEKNIKAMQNDPVFEALPKDILKDKGCIEKLTNSGIGYVL
ncbi:MAG: acyltransferase [Clostridia bacterium]|nr:acyltransferase [Clostridia bacterium]